MAVRTLFLFDILRGLSEKRRGQTRGFFWGQSLPAVSGSPSCPRLQVPAPGLNAIACTDGEDRFGAARPATGSNLENPVRLSPAPGGAGSQQRCPAGVCKAQGQDGGSQPAVPGCEHGPPTGKSLQWFERPRKRSSRRPTGASKGPAS